jgi:hypothetical protein
MLGDAVLVVGLEKTSNNVCFVSVRPHASLWDVYGEVLFRPEDGGQRSRRRRGASGVQRWFCVCR